MLRKIKFCYRSLQYSDIYFFGWYITEPKSSKKAKLGLERPIGMVLGLCLIRGIVTSVLILGARSCRKIGQFRPDNARPLFFALTLAVVFSLDSASVNVCIWERSKLRLRYVSHLRVWILILGLRKLFRLSRAYSFFDSTLGDFYDKIKW